MGEVRAKRRVIALVLLFAVVLSAGMTGFALKAGSTWRGGIDMYGFVDGYPCMIWREQRNSRGLFLLPFPLRDRYEWIVVDEAWADHDPPEAFLAAKREDFDRPDRMDEAPWRIHIHEGFESCTLIDRASEDPLGTFELRIVRTTKDKTAIETFPAETLEELYDDLRTVFEVRVHEPMATKVHWHFVLLLAAIWFGIGLIAATALTLFVSVFRRFLR
ncbi:MAG: hypothetical protein AAF432_01370 [Planctomycetota bacterium]